MLGMFSEGGPAVRKILSDHGVTREAFNTALAKVKTGPVTSDNPEDSYDGPDEIRHRPRAARA